MMQEWKQLATSRYQDHVIAHVIGATALGYFIIDDAAHLLLDISLIWTVYTSGEMALMPQAVVITDLEVEESLKAELLKDAERLHGGETTQLLRMHPAPFESVIQEVKIYERGERRLVLLECEEGNLVIESLPETGEIHLTAVTSDE